MPENTTKVSGVLNAKKSKETCSKAFSLSQ